MLLRGIAYTGNNMMKRRSPPPEPNADKNDDSVYLVYSRNGVDRGGAGGEQNGEAKRKSKSARKKKKNLQNELNQVMS